MDNSKIVRVTHLGDDNYKTGTDPAHDDFNEKLITDPAYWVEKAKADQVGDEIYESDEIEPEPEQPLSEEDKLIYLLEDTYQFRGKLTKASVKSRDWTKTKDKLVEYCMKRMGLGSKEIQSLLKWIETRHTISSTDTCQLPIISGPHLAQIEFPPRTFLMEGYIREGGGQHIFAGPPKEGKSSFLTEVVRCLATGEEFLGLKCAKVPVLYLCNEEDAAAVRERFLEHGALGSYNVHILSQQGVTWDDDLKEELAKAVKQFGIKLLIIDTFNNTFDFEDENDNAVMKKVVTDARLWGYENACSTLMNMHTVKNGAKDLESRLNIRNVRGAGAIIGLPDVIMMFAKSDTKSEVCTKRAISLEGRIERRTHMVIDYDFIEKKYSKVEGGELLSDYFLRKREEENAAQAITLSGAPVDVQLPFEPSSDGARQLLSYIVSGNGYGSQEWLAEKFSVGKRDVNSMIKRLTEEHGFRPRQSGGRKSLVKQ